MDFEKESFNMVHLWESPVHSLCQAQSRVRCLYFGDENGGLTLFDERVGKVSATWDAHDERINSIEFHPENTNMLATSSADGTACIWDVRSMKTKEPDSLKVFKLPGRAQSAYFSPSGRMLAITRYSFSNHFRTPSSVCCLMEGSPSLI
jgi:WD40 repeat protein